MADTARKPLYRVSSDAPAVRSVIVDDLKVGDVLWLDGSASPARLDRVWSRRGSTLVVVLSDWHTSITLPRFDAVWVQT